ncbi:hypothetical protein RvY_10628-2 [Ramazzottius varieornatus]|uniref:Uncharacterized protein n=1 Tax=Ramazzottius varieornatus TaxID=947166 RepID=A0A1D1VDF0_RAMVA|nr:hypothetical protein RvY_10628-2 [Ramazzottius varieornatus]
MPKYESLYGLFHIPRNISWNEQQLLFISHPIHREALQPFIENDGSHIGSKRCRACSCRSDSWTLRRTRT